MYLFTQGSNLLMAVKSNIFCYWENISLACAP